MNNYQKFSVLTATAILFLAQICQMIYAQPLGCGKEKFIGCGTTNPAPPGFDSYWNQVTPGNEGKWGSVEAARNTYNWEGLDQIYNYAIQKGLLYKHHNLIWGQQQPDWISNLDSASQLAEIEEWIRLVGERYPLMDFIDVVNEPLPGHNQPDGGGSPPRANYKKALGGNNGLYGTGWDWVIKSFELARQYCATGVKLVLNDYGIINDNNATTQYLTIINLLKARNLIDGIGVQGHNFELMNKDTAVLRNNLDRLAATGLPVYITEFDLGVDNNSTYDPNIQLSEYQRIFPVLWNHPGVKGITLWGYIEGQCWQVNTFLIYSNGTETAAIQWLKMYLYNGNYRSHQSGEWNDLYSWEKSNGTTWIHPAPNKPTASDGPIIIMDGHKIEVTETSTADQVTILSGGTLMISAGDTLLLKDGIGTDLKVNGTILNSGYLVQEESASIRLNGGGKYTHARDGGEIPTVNWGAGSTCELTSIVSNVPTNIGQDYYNFAWNCPNQTTDLSLGWENGVKIGGTLTVTNTNWNRASITTPLNHLRLFNGSGSCTVGGLSVNGYYAALTSSYTDTITVVGNVTLSNGGMLLLSNSNEGITIYNVKGDLTVTDSAYMGNSNSTNGSKIVFSNAGVQSLNLPSTGLTLFGATSMVVSSGVTLNIGTSVVAGSGNFTVDPGATLTLMHAGGLDSAIQVIGAITLSKQASYTFSGTTAQVTGNLLPDTVNNFVVNNTAGIALSHNVTVNGTLEIQRGGLSSGSNTFSYGPEASLKYSGRSSQTTTDVELPPSGEPKNLVIANLAGVTLHASRTFKGNVEVGGKLMLGSNTLTAANAAVTRTLRYIVTGTGMLKLTGVGSTSEALFPVGTNLYAPVWVKNSGTPDTISVSVVADTTSAPFGGRVMVKWNITENTASGGDYRLTFGWVSQLENTAFRTPNREHNAHIFWLEDTTEAGSGLYTLQYSTQPYTSSRSNITHLGSYAVGRFKDVLDITGVKYTDDNIPKGFYLSENFPNPFNPSTIIKFSLPMRSNVHLYMMNTLGQVVREIAKGNYDAGLHQVTLNGSTLASGVYFYRMETNTGFVQTKKLVLLK